MDKNAIKKYAVWARRELIERVSQRAMIYGITAKDAGDPNAESVNGHLLSQAEKRQRQALIRNIKTKGYEQVMEEVAYTWFNRFVALRFMEVNGYLPSHIRVFTNDAGEFKPQILAEAIHLELEGLDMNKVYELESANKSEELFKYLLIVQCNALNSILPGMFQRIEDYTELLLPDYLLRDGSVVHRLVTDIPEADFDVRSEEGQIEVIGWLYQYYISEKHDEVVDPLHGKVVQKEEVPAATQLFTTDWVVRYLVDNSVGRYWIERNPNSVLGGKLTYFVKPKNSEIKYVDDSISPQQLSIFDPCVGSGHFLIYAFDVLMEIYKEYGYSEREAASEIVKNNLYGLDIDGRAIQLAYFAVMMKARQYDRRFFTRGIQPNVYEILESNSVDQFSVEAFCGDNTNLKKDIDAILKTMEDAKEYGSILQVPTIDFDLINERFLQLSDEVNMYNMYLLGEFQMLIKAAEVLSGKYAVVATNPPYMNKYDPKLKKYIYDQYADYKGDLFSVFIYRNLGFCKDGGYSGMMTPMVWMFIQTYENLRNYIIRNKEIASLIQMEYSAYEEATVPICSFVLRNNQKNEKGSYFKLSEFTGGMEVQKAKVLEAINSSNCAYFYEALQDRFTDIPGAPIAFWLNPRWFDVFDQYPVMRDVCVLKKGTSTGDNKRFIRQWQEVDFSKTCLIAKTPEDAVASKKKWFPINGGGERRKWYGNRFDVVNWESDGAEMKALATKLNHGGHWSRYIINPDRFFTEAIGWSAISSSRISARYVGYGFAFSSAAMEAFEADLKYILALINSVVAEDILKLLAPTINFGVEQIGRIPFIKRNATEIERITDECINVSKEDWDSFEISWDFKEHPFITSVRQAEREGKEITIKQAFADWKNVAEGRFQKLKINEEELNRIFIDVYGLGDELSPEVEDKDVTVRKADIQREVRSFISYAVGCMFGRYSLDVPGLVCAGGMWDASKYTTFRSDKDAIIPICDDEYFEDDIVGRFVKFVEVVYGKEMLEENLRFIADALGGKGSSREVIRNYFINDFYADHLKVYQKRPIYWLFDSGKKNGFKCLIYMHRYQPDTIARIRTDYVHEQQSRYRTAIADLEQRINGASTSERVKLSKQLSTLQAQAEEIRIYEEKIHHLADQMIKIDLDDGVKHNYEIFKDVLAKIK